MNSLPSVSFFSRVLYETMWRNTVQPDRSHRRQYGAWELHAG